MIYLKTMIYYYTSQQKTIKTWVGVTANKNSRAKACLFR